MADMASQKVKRWGRQSAQMSASHSSGAPLDEQQGILSASVCTGRMIEDGVAYFPVMSENEVAAISVPAPAPPDRLRSILATDGVCLVTGVLDPEQCRLFESFWKADLLGVLGMAKSDASKIAISRLREHGVKAWPHKWSSFLGKKGTVSQRGLPHGEFAWNCRTHAGVRKIFADTFETSVDDLVVGLDCVFWSSSDTAAAESNPEWLHCDQNHRTGLTWPCVQGVLYVWPSVGEGASTTVVWPGSHRGVYDRIMEDSTAITRGRSMGGQSVRISHLSNPRLRDELTHEAMVGCRRVPCPAGSLLLWDSRTIHQGWAGGPRLAQPVCWEPRQRRESDSSALGRKLFMCAAGLPSSHSSAEARLHGMAPRSRPCEVLEGDDMPAIKNQIRPYCIDERKRREWEQAQNSLWRRGAIDDTDSRMVVDLMKAEVLKVL